MATFLSRRMVGGLGVEEGAPDHAGPAGHEIFTPTFTGLGERAQQASPPSRSTPTWRCAGRAALGRRGPGRASATGAPPRPGQATRVCSLRQR
jgi:hypothetical protein